MIAAPDRHSTTELRPWTSAAQNIVISERLFKIRAVKVFFIEKGIASRGTFHACSSTLRVPFQR